MSRHATQYLDSYGYWFIEEMYRRTGAIVSIAYTSLHGQAGNASATGMYDHIGEILSLPHGESTSSFREQFPDVYNQFLTAWAKYTSPYIGELGSAS